jgi:hypothetical protein
VSPAAPVAAAVEEGEEAVVEAHEQQQVPYTDKKEKKIFLIYKEIQSGAVDKSYMRKGFLIYEEMRKYFTIYEEAVSHI